MKNIKEPDIPAHILEKVNEEALSRDLQERKLPLWGSKAVLLSRLSTDELWAAAKRGDLPTVEKLHTKGGAEVDPEVEPPPPPLMLGAAQRSGGPAMGATAAAAAPHHAGGGAGGWARRWGGLGPLHVAAAGNHAGVAKYLLAHGAAPGRRGRGGLTPLHLAAREGHTKVLRLLLEAGGGEGAGGDAAAAADDMAATGRTPAAFDDARRASAAAAPFADRRDARGRGALALAAGGGHFRALRLLYAHGAALESGEEDPSGGGGGGGGTAGGGGRSLVHLAAAGGHTKIVQFLASRGLGLDTVDANGRSPLHLAAKNGRAETCKFLAEHNTYVDRLDAKQLTPLQLAAREGHARAARALLRCRRGCRADAEAKTPSDRRTALHLAALHGHPEVVRVLCGPGRADPDCRDTDAKTPLHLAAARGRAAAGRALLAAGAAAAPVDRSAKNTPLHVAAAGGHAAFVAMLLEHAASALKEEEEKRKEQEESELDSTAKSSVFNGTNNGISNGTTTKSAMGRRFKAKKPVPSIESLLQAGDGFGRTPLHLAALCRKPRREQNDDGWDDKDASSVDDGAEDCSEGVIAALLAVGADPGIRDGLGATPLDAALRSHNEGAVALLAAAARSHPIAAARSSLSLLQDRGWHRRSTKQAIPIGVVARPDQHELVYAAARAARGGGGGGGGGGREAGGRTTRSSTATSDAAPPSSPESKEVLLQRSRSLGEEPPSNVESRLPLITPSRSSMAMISPVNHDAALKHFDSTNPKHIDTSPIFISKKKITIPSGKDSEANSQPRWTSNPSLQRSNSIVSPILKEQRGPRPRKERRSKSDAGYMEEENEEGQFHEMQHPLAGSMQQLMNSSGKSILTSINDDDVYDHENG